MVRVCVEADHQTAWLIKVHLGCLSVKANVLAVPAMPIVLNALIRPVSTVHACRHNGSLAVDRDGFR